MSRLMAIGIIGAMLLVATGFYIVCIAVKAVVVKFAVAAMDRRLASHSKVQYVKS